jgi:hypothetical protein
MMVGYLSWVDFLSDFADESVIIPLSMVIGLVLWLLGWRKGCYGWLIAVFGTLSGIVLSKLFFYFLTGFRFIHLPINLISPSSHAAAGSLVYGSLLALLLRGGRAGMRTALVTSGLFALFFSLTRLELGVHTRSEVLFGSLLGMAGAVAFVRIAGKMPHELNKIRLAAASAIVVLMVYGHKWKGEQPIRYVATAMQVIVKTAFGQQRE